MRWKRAGRLRAPARSSGWGSLLVLAVCFLGGAALGQVFSGHVPEAAGEELRRYLTDYLALEDGQAPSVRAALSAAVLYVRYPLLAFLLGFAPAGVVLLPVLSAAFGFFASFSVCCFTAAFGAKGAVLALAALGPRCAVTLPCFFLLAVPALRFASALTALPFGRGRRAAQPVRDREFWLRFWGCAGAEAAGVCVELFLSPELIRLAFERIFS